MGIKKLIKKIIYGPLSDSLTFIKYARSKGAHIGDDVNFYDFDRCIIDTLNLHLLDIGDHVNIVASTILTHDYAWSVLKYKYGSIEGNQRPVIIGNNVFIGLGSVILGGTKIENNVIVGANSVVSGVLEHDSVYAGNPAKRIMSLEDYYNKRQSRQFEEAKEFVLRWKKAFNEFPPEDALHEYFFLFSNGKNLNVSFDNKLKQCGNYDQSMNYLCNNKPMFNSYEDFLSACKN